MECEEKGLIFKDEVYAIVGAAILSFIVVVLFVVGSRRLGHLRPRHQLSQRFRGNSSELSPRTGTTEPKDEARDLKPRQAARSRQSGARSAPSESRQSGAR